MSADDDLRAARRAVLESPDDELLRIRLERIEERLGLRNNLEAETLVFWNAIRQRWRSCGLGLEFSEARILVSQFVLPLVAAPTRDAPRWSWIRGTQAGWGERPMPFAVRIGDQVAVAVERVRTGPQNLVQPDMVWPELAPWGPGAHEHTRQNGNTPVELVFSWAEDPVAGICRQCGERTTARRTVAQGELNDRLRAWFASTAVRKTVASTDAVRYFVDGLRVPAGRGGGGD